MKTSEIKTLDMKDVQTTNINFMGQRHIAMVLSAILIIASFAGLWVKGLNFGIDFTGGTLIELSYPTPVELPELRNNLTESGFGQAIVQHFGSAEDVLIRIAPQDGLNSAQLSNHVMDALAAPRKRNYASSSGVRRASSGGRAHRRRRISGFIRAFWCTYLRRTAL